MIFVFQNLVLYSPQACVRLLDENHSLSTGAVLLITFFSLVFAYVVLGMVVNYFLVGARGIEMLPHLSFWRDFPSLVKVCTNHFNLWLWVML